MDEWKVVNLSFPMFLLDIIKKNAFEALQSKLAVCYLQWMRLSFSKMTKSAFNNSSAKCDSLIDSPSISIPEENKGQKETI